jgi:hypothetical protein
MRLRLAFNSLAGSPYAPMVMTVTPAVDWGNLTVADFKTAETDLSRFLLTHPNLDQTVGALSALK